MISTPSSIKHQQPHQQKFKCPFNKILSAPSINHERHQLSHQQDIKDTICPINKTLSAPSQNINITLLINNTSTTSTAPLTRHQLSHQQPSTTSSTRHQLINTVAVAVPFNKTSTAPSTELCQESGRTDGDLHCHYVLHCN